jgi:hypothetical protein
VGKESKKIPVSFRPLFKASMVSSISFIEEKKDEG